MVYTNDAKPILLMVGKGRIKRTEASLVASVLKLRADYFCYIVLIVHINKD